MIEEVLRGATITLHDEANSVALDVIVVRHEIGACEADIILDEDEAVAGTWLQQYA
jgi:hypothetical protein